MSAWETEHTITRDEAIARIKTMAIEEGIKGTFKVFYNETLISNPTDLPERVDMDKVRVSATLDNA